MRTLAKGLGICLAFWAAIIAVSTGGAYVYDKVSVAKLRRDLAANARPILGGMSVADYLEAIQVRSFAIRRLAIGLYEIRVDDRRRALFMLRLILQHKTDPEWWVTKKLTIETLDPYLLVEYIATGTLPSTEDD